MDIRNHHMGVNFQLRLKGKRLVVECVEDVEDPIEVRPPSDHHLLVVLRVDEPGEYAPSPISDAFLPDLHHGPAIESGVSESCIVCITG